MPSAQLPLPFPAGPLDRASLIVTADNAEAVAALERWEDWPDRKLVLAGEAATGKSHLAAIWAADTGAARLDPNVLADLSLPALADIAVGPIVLDDADRVRDSEKLLHLLNLISQRGGALLLTGRTQPTLWAATLGDLSTRLAALQVVHIAQPSDEALLALIQRRAAARGILLDEATGRVVLTRLERTFADAHAFLNAFEAELARSSAASPSTLARRAVAALYPAP